MGPVCCQCSDSQALWEMKTTKSERNHPQKSDFNLFRTLISKWSEVRKVKAMPNSVKAETPSPAAQVCAMWHWPPAEGDSPIQPELKYEIQHDEDDWEFKNPD